MRELEVFNKELQKIKKSIMIVIEKLNKVIKNTTSKATFVMEMVFFIGIFIIVITNFILNFFLGMYFLGGLCITYSIFLYKMAR